MKLFIWPIAEPIVLIRVFSLNFYLGIHSAPIGTLIQDFIVVFDLIHSVYMIISEKATIIICLL